MDVTVTLSCLLQYFLNQVGGGRWGFRGPLNDSIPTASPFSLSTPSVQTGLCHWPSSLGKLPWSPSLTTRKWFTNWPILWQKLGFPPLVFSFEYLERNTNRISTAVTLLSVFQTCCKSSTLSKFVPTSGNNI